MRYLVSLVATLVVCVLVLTLRATNVAAQTSVIVTQGEGSTTARGYGPWWVGGPDGGPVAVTGNIVVTIDGGSSGGGGTSSAFFAPMPANGTAIGIQDPSGNMEPLFGNAFGSAFVSLQSLDSFGGGNYLPIGGEATTGYSAVSSGTNNMLLQDGTFAYVGQYPANPDPAYASVAATPEFCFSGGTGMGALAANGGYIPVYPGQQAVVQFSSPVSENLAVSAYGLVDRGSGNNTQTNASFATAFLCSQTTGNCTTTVTNPGNGSIYRLVGANNTSFSLYGVYISTYAAGSITAQVCAVPNPSVPSAEGFNSRGIVSVGNTATLVIPTYGRRLAGQVQNQSTAAVFCDLTSAVTTSSYAWVLKAGAGAADGSGGQVSLPAAYAGPVYCIVATGTANVSEDDL